MQSFRLITLWHDKFHYSDHGRGTTSVDSTARHECITLGANHQFVARRTTDCIFCKSRTLGISLLCMYKEKYDAKSKDKYRKSVKEKR
jgi:hypothetical protein